MTIFEARTLVKAVLLTGAMIVGAAAAVAQTPGPSPTPNPAQRDATRPPGSEQNQTAPPESRPNTQNPQAPPGSQQNPAPAPPGTNVTPQTPGQPSATPVPTPVPGVPNEPSTVAPTGDQTPQEPNIPPAQTRPLPPLPNLTRLGVSGNTIALSLNDAIKRALENNNDIEVSRDDVRFAETQLRSLQGVYQPIFSFTPTYDHRITPQQSVLGGSGQSGVTSSTTYTFSPSVTKSFGTGGGTYTVSFANQHTDTSSTFSFINPYYSSNLSLNFTQPLWRNRSIDNNRHQIRVQKKRIEQSDADFRQKTIDVISNVQSAYWDLVFALRDQQIQLANLNLSRENLKQVEAQIAAGAKAPLERAEVLTELANRESTLLTATQTVSIAENNLKQLILKDTQAAEWSSQLTPTDTPVFDMNPVNLNDAIAESRKNRPDLQRLRIQREINSLDIQYFKNQTRPQVDLQATLATTGLAGSTVTQATAPGTPVPLISGDPNLDANAFLLQQIQDVQQRAGFPVAVVPLVPAGGAVAPADLIGGYAKDLSNLFGFRTRNITVGVAIQFPFKNQTAEANLAGARIQKEQLEASMRAQEQFAEVDVRNAAQAVESARQRVLSAREARANAEVQLEGEQRLYAVGRSTTFLLFQRENALANARDQELRAETDYNKALAGLQRATSTTLRANNVLVDSPTR